MVKLTSQNIIKLSKLSNLPLKKTEIEKYKRQLDTIIGYVNELNNVDTKDVEITSQTTGLKNITREDKNIISLDKNSVLSESKSTFNDYFKVPLVLKEKDI